MRFGIGARAAQAAVVEVRALLRETRGRLLTVEEDEANLPPARLQLHLPQRVCDLHDDGRARSAVVRADEALGIGERVVVSADHDAGAGPRDRPDDVAQPRLAWQRLEASVREPYAQPRRQCLQLGRARWPLAVAQLHPHERPRTAGVETVDP